MASYYDQDNFQVFGFWGGILVLKMLATILLTIAQRMRKQVFSNPEDTKLRREGKVSFEDPDVERVRRAHLNDLENILPWLLVTWIWLGTEPSTILAGWLIRIFVISRILHTIVYAVIPVPQPTRAIIFFVGFLITGYMAISTLFYYHW